MSNEKFVRELLVPYLEIPFEASFRKKQLINDIKNIFIIHFLHNSKDFNGTIEDFIKSVMNIRRPELLDFVLDELMNLIETNVVLNNFLKTRSKEEVKESYIYQFSIHKEIEKEFHNNNFIGLETKLKNTNMLYKRNLITLEEEIINSPSNFNREDSSNYKFLDPRSIFSKANYEEFLKSLIKEYFNGENNYSKNMVFIDYLLQGKNKEDIISTEYLEWHKEKFSFTLENNEIKIIDKKTHEYIKQIKELNTNEDGNFTLSVEDIINDLLDINKILDIKKKLEFVIESNVDNNFSKILNEQIVNWVPSEEEKDLSSLFQKCIKYNGDETFIVCFNKFEIKCMTLKKEIEAFSKKHLDIENLFKNDQIYLENRIYSKSIVELLFKHFDFIKSHNNFSGWFLTNLHQINSIEYLQAKEIINILNNYDSNNILNILSKTKEFKNKNIKDISEDLYDFLREKHFSDWGGLNVKFNFEYNQNNYLFNKKWPKEREIEKFYKKLEDLHYFKSKIEDKNLSEDEYKELTKELKDNFEVFLNSFIDNIFPITKQQITAYSSFQSNISKIKEILNSSSFEYKKNKLHQMRNLIESKIGATGENKSETLSKLLNKFKNKQAVKELKEIISKYLNPASHNTETSEFKKQINNLTFEQLDILKEKINQWINKLNE